MSKSFIPRVSYRDIDLKEFGAEGTLRVFAYSPQMTMTIGTNLANRLIDAGLADAKDALAHIEELAKRYNAQYIEECIKVSVFSIQGSVKVPLEDEDIQFMAPDLYNRIVDVLAEVNSFPLGQKGGEASKKGQSKHTSAESSTEPTMQKSST